MFNKYFWPMFILVSLITILHLVAIAQFYYWTLAWYDIMMHFLGGFWLTLFFFWLHSIKPHLFKPRLFGVICFVFAVGLLWEGYELFFKMAFVSDIEYLPDTSLDIVMDMLGGSIAFFLARSKPSQSNV